MTEAHSSVTSTDSVLTPESSYGEGLVAHQAGEFQKAWEHYIAAWWLSGEKHALSALHLGILALQQQDAEKARSWLENALQLAPYNAEAALNLARASLLLGNAPAAESHAARALALGIEPARGWYWLGQARAKQGKLLLAREALEEAARAAPQSAAIRQALAELPTMEALVAPPSERVKRPQQAYAEAVAAARRADWAASVAAFTRAIAGDPKNATYLAERAGARFYLGDAAGARDDAKAAVILDRRNPAAWCNLGLALKALDDETGAEQAFREAVKLAPQLFEAQLNLAGLLIGAQRAEQADVSSRRALALQPNSAGARNNRAAYLLAMGATAAALPLAESAVDQDPANAEAWLTLANIYFAGEDYERARQVLLDALAKNPDRALLWVFLADLEHRLGNLEKALPLYLSALNLCCDRTEAVTVKLYSAQFYLHAGFATKGAALTRELLTSKPNQADLWAVHGALLAALGRREESMAAYHKSLELKPKQWATHSQLLFLYAYQGWGSEAAMLAEAQRFEQLQVPEEVRFAPHQHVRPRRAGRRLRVGYVSGDFCEHSISYFITQVLLAHNRQRLEVFAYSTRDVHDAVTEQIQAAVNHWRPIARLANVAAKALIEEDGIDVLIDLSGHTGHHRLMLFAMKPAPVQAHYLGFMGTTGLSAIDYWISDPVLHPPGVPVPYVEEIWRLPRVWVSYRAGEDAPPVAPRQRLPGRLTFGSFNNIKKISETTLDLWARLLVACPEADLLLKTRDLQDEGQCHRLKAAFAVHGIGAERLLLLPGQPSNAEHLDTYNLIDCVVDTFPFTGGTTTCDALWMGAPLVTLAGSRMGERMSASMLAAVGREDWVARDGDEYIHLAIAIARASRAGMIDRPGLRAAMAASPLTDAKGLAAALEDAYEAMFDRWWDRCGASNWRENTVLEAGDG